MIIFSIIAYKCSLYTQQIVHSMSEKNIIFLQFKYKAYIRVILLYDKNSVATNADEKMTMHIKT